MEPSARQDRACIESGIDALRELRCRAHRFTQGLELPWVGSALRRCVVRQRGPHLAQGLDGARFGLRVVIALALRHDEPQETPDRGEEKAQQKRQTAAEYFCRDGFAAG